MIIGGGWVAARKAASLVDAGAEVTVISPELCPVLTKMVADSAVRHESRRYIEGDLRGAFIAIAATDDPDTNLTVCDEGSSRGTLVNCVRPPYAGDFIVPSSVHRAALTVAISTGGGCPALSKRLRQDIEALIGREYGEFLSYLEEARNRLKETVPDEAKRQLCLTALVDSGLLEAFKSLPAEEARVKVEETLSKLTSSLCININKL